MKYIYSIKFPYIGDGIFPFSRQDGQIAGKYRDFSMGLSRHYESARKTPGTPGTPVVAKCEESLQNAKM
jgi:hypothetical protein